MYDYASMTDEQLREAIEPWQPHDGDIVRVHLSPECQHIYRAAMPMNGSGEMMQIETGHRPELEEGLIGVVTNPPNGAQPHNAHVYRVQLERLLPLPGNGVSLGTNVDAMMYAAFELEPVVWDGTDWIPKVIAAESNRRGKYERGS